MNVCSGSPCTDLVSILLYHFRRVLFVVARVMLVNGKNGSDRPIRPSTVQLIALHFSTSSARSFRQKKLNPRLFDKAGRYKHRRGKLDKYTIGLSWNNELCSCRGFQYMVFLV